MSADLACAIVRRNGAYLVSLQDPTGDVTPGELYDCAGSLRRAKQVARSMAETIGYMGPFRWESHAIGLWELYAAWEHGMGSL